MEHNHRGSETSAMPCPACAEPYYIERPVYQAALEKIAALQARVQALTKHICPCPCHTEDEYPCESCCFGPVR